MLLKCHYKAKNVKQLWGLLAIALGFGFYGQETWDFPQRIIIIGISFVSQTHLCLLTVKPWYKAYLLQMAVPKWHWMFEIYLCEICLWFNILTIYLIIDAIIFINPIKQWINICKEGLIVDIKMTQHRAFFKSMARCIWKRLSEVLTILLKQITLKENTYGSILCLLAQLNMFTGTGLQPAEWILFYPYADYRTKEETVKIIQLLFYNSRWKTRTIHGFPFSSHKFRAQN